MNKINERLIMLADELDKKEYISLANEIDRLIKKYAQSTPDWGAKDRQKKEYDLWNKFIAKEITKDEYNLELDKLEQQGRDERDPHYEQRIYDKMKKK